MGKHIPRQGLVQALEVGKVRRRADLYWMREAIQGVEFIEACFVSFLYRSESFVGDGELVEG